MKKRKPEKPTITERRANVDLDNTIILQQCQLPGVLKLEKTVLDQWIKEGKLRYFRAKPGGTRIFIVKHLFEDIDKMYNTWNHNDRYEIGGR